MIIIGPTDESQPYVSSAAASQALKQAGVVQHVLNLGDNIDSRESKDITYNTKRIYFTPYEKLGGIAPRVAGDLQRGKAGFMFLFKQNVSQQSGFTKVKPTKTLCDFPKHGKLM